jgi:hypothetical protein
LIGKVQNATSSTVADKLATVGLTSFSSLSALSKPDATVINKLKQLQSTTGMAQSQVFIFEQQPLIGVSKTIEPSGFTRCYEYDSFGRFSGSSILKDGTKQNVEMVNYSLVNE